MLLRKLKGTMRRSKKIEKNRDNSIMFTGIIKEIGIIRSVLNMNGVIEITVGSSLVNSDSIVDDSIAVNGICLTVTKKNAASFTVQAVRETVLRSNIKSFAENMKVNLEPALRPNDRLGGHIVQGHIDGTGEVLKVIPQSIGKEFLIRTEKETLRYIVNKGSVCIDGISLTVADVRGNEFRAAVIPHTENNTTAKDWRAGTIVNIETDIIGRYIEKFISPVKTDITIEKLSELGY
ncbi:TPA: riboflavin synthase [Candidatus Delongbacteria bacterium]|nr:riboflavin synthase [Candidatus Delongbacteria bacterium]